MNLQAPERWRCLDFISDLHLQAGEPQTFAAWQSYLASTCADALFILGDLFEVWVGDDVLQFQDSFEAQCAQALKQASLRMDIFIMHGNRDFLMGAGLMQACGAQLLEDPCVLTWAGERHVLSHGDALCTADEDYMRFRNLVRTQAWCDTFLAKPLIERQGLARDIREQSEQKKQASTQYVDLDSTAVTALLDKNQSGHMIHGHTHQPARHVHGPQHIRDVLSDWHVCSPVVRAEVYRMSWSGVAKEPPLHQRLAPFTAG